MGKRSRFVLMAIGAVVALVLIVAVCVPLFLNADSFRPRIESTLSKSLGRKVTIGKLELSLWSGGLVASNSTVADDPAFSNRPFIGRQRQNRSGHSPSDFQPTAPHTGICADLAQGAIASRGERHV